MITMDNLIVVDAVFRILLFRKIKKSGVIFFHSIWGWRIIENAQFLTEQKSDPYSTVIFTMYLNTLKKFFQGTLC